LPCSPRVLASTPTRRSSDLTPASSRHQEAAGPGTMLQTRPQGGRSGSGRALRPNVAACETGACQRPASRPRGHHDSRACHRHRRPHPPHGKDAELMTWIHSIFAFRNARLVQDAAEELVARVWPWVWQRVKDRAIFMSPAEARGYVRAHASELVRATAVSIVQKHDSLQEWAEESI